MFKRPETKSNFDDVGEFHTKFGLRSSSRLEGQGPQELTSELLEFRVKFMLEELLEFAKAAGYAIYILDDGVPEVVRVTHEVDHEGMFDALIDEVYVAMGTAHLFGYPWQKGWNLVQQANMTKVRAESAEDSTRGTSLDVVKPPGWTPPDIEALLTTFNFPTSLNNPDLMVCAICGIVRGEHHSEIDHNFRGTKKR